MSPRILLYCEHISISDPTSNGVRMTSTHQLSPLRRICSETRVNGTPLSTSCGFSILQTGMPSTLKIASPSWRQVLASKQPFLLQSGEPNHAPPPGFTNFTSHVPGSWPLATVVPIVPSLLPLELETISLPDMPSAICEGELGTTCMLERIR